MRVELNDARVNDDWAERWAPARNCIDGSRVSGCATAGRWSQSWLSARMRSGASETIHSVAIYAQSNNVAPFEVWLGSSIADSGPRSVKCATVTQWHPPNDRTPLMLPCAGVGHSHITVKYVGARRALQMNELVVFAQPPPSGSAASARPARGLDALNRRYAHGRPSEHVAEAGVLFHKFDQYVVDGQPWALAPEYDHLSVSASTASLTAEARGGNPWGYFPGGDYAGFVLAQVHKLHHLPTARKTSSLALHACSMRLVDASLLILTHLTRPLALAFSLCTFAQDAEVLCGYSADVGTGAAVNGGCGACSASGCSGAARHGATMTQATRWGGNEIIIGQLYWDQHLPWAVEAFVFAGGAQAEAHARAVRGEFLSHFAWVGGDLESEIPLLRFLGNDGFVVT